MMPGRTLHHLATHICSTKTLERIVEPAIADLQKEYSTPGRASRRAWVLLAGYVAVLRVILVCAVNVSTTTSDERQALSRALAWSFGGIASISALLILPPLLNYSMRRWDAVIALVPQAVPLGIPMGIAIGIAFGLCARPAMNVVKVTVLGAAVASAVSFGILAWVMPVANQTFRDIAIRELADNGYQVTSEPQKGHNEMTLSELSREEASFAAAGETRLPRQFAFTFHMRFALAAATLVLAAVLLAVPFNHRGLRGLVAFATFCFYWALIYIGEALAVYSAVAPDIGGTLPPFVGAWLPNIVLGAVAVVFATSRSSRPCGLTSAPR